MFKHWVGSKTKSVEVRFQYFTQSAIQVGCGKLSYFYTGCPPKNVSTLQQLIAQF